MKKKTVVTVVSVVLIAVIAVSYLSMKKKNSAGEYKTVKVERGKIEEKVSATGRIEAFVTVSVGSQVSGIIKELLADYNSVVKKDQVIALLEPSILAAQKKQAEANLASAQANLEKSEVALEDARRNLKRGEELFNDKLISESDMDALKTAYESAAAQILVAQSQVKQSEASLSMSAVNLTHTVITSPVDGIVISRDVDVGQTVAASLQAPTLFTIANDLSKMQVHSDIAESDVGKIKEGQEVTFRVDAFPKEEFIGRVSQVRNEGKIVQNVVTYDAVIDVENKELKLKPGMTAYVSILVARNENALKIPNTALRFKPSKAAEEKQPDAARRSEPVKVPDSSLKSSSNQKGSGPRQAKGASAAPSGFDNPVVWLLKDGKAVPANVKIGITDGKNSEVVEGDIAEGDEVITEELNASKKDTATMPGFGGRGIR